MAQHVTDPLSKPRLPPLKRRMPSDRLHLTHNSSPNHPKNQTRAFPRTHSPPSSRKPDLLASTAPVFLLVANKTIGCV